jgi:N-acetyl-gamma-glutamyl-phosphate reductase
MIRAGIVGVTGYTGYELYRLLRSHPEAEPVWLTSESSAGLRLSDVFPCPWEQPLLVLAEAPLDEVDVAFLCLPHGASMDAVARTLAAGTRVVDLSADFRLHSPQDYQRWYGLQHSQPDLLAQAVYGLPELHRDAIAGSQLVANPGCYPTSVILGLWPLARQGWLGGTVIVDSKSGVSGAGRKPKLSTSFVEANENLSPYSIGYAHRHIAEMEQELRAASPQPQAVVQPGQPQFIFSPHLVPISRGILSTIYLTLPIGVDEAQVREAYKAVYLGEPFVHLLPAGQVATLQHTVGTNRCAIGLTVVPGSQTVIVTSSLDNLVKGASGQAVQNMNVMFGVEETAGLV